MIPFWSCSSRRRRLNVGALLIAAAGLTACSGTHLIEVEPTHHTIEVKPIYLTVDVNIRVQKELDQFFEDVEKPAKKEGEGT